MPWYSRVPGAWIFTHEIDFRPAWRAFINHAETVIIAAGVFLRLLVYLQNREYWIDEASLEFNVTNKPPLDFSAALFADQLAPLGFLIVERIIIAVLGSARYVTRLLPFACGILALFLFAKLAGRILARPGLIVALALFAFSDDLIYYSSELKPYTLDLALGLAITLLAYDAITAPLTTRRVVLIASVAVFAPWFSFASSFVVAGCGAALLLAAKSLRLALIWSAIGVIWLLSFALAYDTSHGLLSPYTTMYLFWHFAFLPLLPFPPDQANLAKAGGLLLEIMVNPLNLVAPIPRWLGIALPAFLLLAGAVRLFRRSRPVWLMLVLPFALAVVASILKRYPLHGRLLLEMVPAFFILIALGTELVFEFDRGDRKRVFKTVVILLLAYPCFSALYETSARRWRNFNRHGDLHNNRFLIEKFKPLPPPIKTSG